MLVKDVYTTERITIHKVCLVKADQSYHAAIHHMRQSIKAQRLLVVKERDG
jgi:hypothetical protein